MLPLAALAVGALLGFVGSRLLRRRRQAPAAVPAPADHARPVSPPVLRRGGLTLPELQRACFAEMVRQVGTDPSGGRRVPDEFVLHLHPDDLAQVEESRGWFTDGLIEALQAEAEVKGWQMAPTVGIALAGDDSRRRGLPRAEALVPPVPTPAPEPDVEARTAPGPRRLSLWRADTGERVVLGTDRVTIGRADTSTLQVDDTRVSRTHAVVEPSRSGWAITDQGSSNGTTVNGRLLSPHAPQPLSGGDRISIGPVELRVQSAAGSGAGSGS